MGTWTGFVAQFVQRIFQGLDLLPKDVSIVAEELEKSWGKSRGVMHFERLAAQSEKSPVYAQNLGEDEYLMRVLLSVIRRIGWRTYKPGGACLA